MNSELYGNTYKLPPEILQHLQATLTTYPQGDGVKRAKYLLKNGSVTYQSLKRLKNFFDNFSGEPLQQYQLAGGDLMRGFCDQKLNIERDGVEKSKEIKRDVTTNVAQVQKPQQIPQMNEEEDDGDPYDMSVHSAGSGYYSDDKKQNAVAVVVNNDNQILLLKRSKSPDIWQPGKYALVGGAIEEGETPEQAVRREITEETGIAVDLMKEKFKIGRANSDSEEYIFLAKYDGDPHDIKLNFEHDAYGWYDPNEIHFLNHVPYLMEYVNMVFKKDE